MKIPDDFGELERRLRGSKVFDANNLPVGRLVLGALGLVVLLVGVLSSYYQVAPEGEAVVQRFGRVSSVQPPGLHFKLPFGIDKVTFVPTQQTLKQELGFRSVMGRSGRAEYRSDLDEALMLTGDLNILRVEWVVQYRVPEPVKWLFAARNPEQTIRDISESVMRRIVGNQLGADVLTEARVEIAVSARLEMQEIFDGYGIGVEVTSIELQDVTPPDQVAPAFNAVNESRQEKERLVNEAEKQRNEVIPRARGEAAQIVSEAQAYAAERVNRARGEASRYEAILAQYEKSKSVTRQRLFLEMIDHVLPSIGNLYVIDESGHAPLPILDLKTATRSEGGVR